MAACNAFCMPFYNIRPLCRALVAAFNDLKSVMGNVQIGAGCCTPARRRALQQLGSPRVMLCAALGVVEPAAMDHRCRRRGLQHAWPHPPASTPGTSSYISPSRASPRRRPWAVVDSARRTLQAKLGGDAARAAAIPRRAKGTREQGQDCISKSRQQGIKPHAAPPAVGPDQQAGGAAVAAVGATMVSGQGRQGKGARCRRIATAQLTPEKLTQQHSDDHMGRAPDPST
jgi:hypothetical protein